MLFGKQRPFYYFRARDLFGVAVKKSKRNFQCGSTMVIHVYEDIGVYELCVLWIRPVNLCLSSTSHSLGVWTLIMIRINLSAEIGPTVEYLVV